MAGWRWPEGLSSNQNRLPSPNVFEQNGRGASVSSKNPDVVAVEEITTVSRRIKSAQTPGKRPSRSIVRIVHHHGEVYPLAIDDDPDV